MTWRSIDRVLEADEAEVVHAVRIVVRPEPWMEEALCRHMGTVRDRHGRPVLERVGRWLMERRHYAWIDRTFFPERGGDWATAAAVAVCMRCPVWRQCLDYALRNRERHGVWGGTTPEQRKAIWSYRGEEA